MKKTTTEDPSTLLFTHSEVHKALSGYFHERFANAGYKTGDETVMTFKSGYIEITKDVGQGS